MKMVKNKDFPEEQQQNKDIIYHLDQLERYYTRKSEIVKAIDGITMNIKVGEFVTILGPSGSGKTTLLNLLSGLDSPTGGKILFEGTELNTLSDDELCEFRRHDIGIVFQFFNLHPALTAQENIEYPMMIADVDPEHRKQRVQALLKAVNLEKKAGNYPMELSGGEKQRIGIARALANKPKVIIADEPTGDLDSELSKDIIELLFDVNQQGTTIVMVTHDETLLEESMRIIRLQDGRLKKMVNVQQSHPHHSPTPA